MWNLDISYLEGTEEDEIAQRFLLILPHPPLCLCGEYLFSGCPAGLFEEQDHPGGNAG